MLLDEIVAIKVEELEKDDVDSEDKTKELA